MHRQLQETLGLQRKIGTVPSINPLHFNPLIPWIHWIFERHFYSQTNFFKPFLYIVKSSHNSEFYLINHLNHCVVTGIKGYTNRTGLGFFVCTFFFFNRDQNKKHWFSINCPQLQFLFFPHQLSQLTNWQGSICHPRLKGRTERKMKENMHPTWAGDLFHPR